MTGMTGLRTPVFLFSMIWALLCLNLPVQAAMESFNIEDIRLDGLKRISAGTVFNYLPIKSGDYLDEDGARATIHTLFKTGLFSDVKLLREGNVLIIAVAERPTIAKITYNGNSDVETEDLEKNLKNIGFAEGRIFDRSMLDKVEQELKQQYYSAGKYAVRVEQTVTPQSRNRVNIHFEISEGKAAKIRQINIVGNQVFDDGDLLESFEMAPTAWYRLFGSRDQYSSQKLGGDLETLRAYYLDHGYLNFSIDSTQVSITPDKQNIYITINVSEGDKYFIKDINLLGNLILPEEELRKALKVKAGDVFSRKEITASTEAINELLGDEGYIFAKVNGIPNLQPGEKEVSLNVFIDPNRRIYVRRINFEGNTRTRDEVLRREMRQMEGALASSAKIKRSKLRLQRLRFFEDVTIDTIPVPNEIDQVDVNVAVKELPGGNLMAGVGFSQAEGFLLSASISQDNFLGSGDNFSIAFNNSDINREYSFSYAQPYFTVDGISQRFGLYFRETDAEEANLSRYALDTIGGNLVYGFPINEHDSYRLGIEPESLRVKSTDNSSSEILDYIDRYGDKFMTYKLIGGWSHDTRNDGLFPDRGVLQSLNAEVALPFGDLDYYKITYRQQWYLPLSRDFTFLTRADIAYGETFGDKEFPFFENFTAGGPRTVRGFKENTLGPRDSLDYPLGGNLRVVGNFELLMPMPFISNSKSMRLSAFVDVGNVYGPNEDFDASTLRYSTGVSALWYSPMGALSFSFARPLRKEDGDRTQAFQFSLGTNF